MILEVKMQVVTDIVLCSTCFVLGFRACGYSLILETCVLTLWGRVQDCIGVTDV